ncbi:PucR family transcriptional regulator [Rossellomorea aquimaris]|uniref:PucR family transcriptional regulator n=1 Tax=Rossellomorea aquimaris TaxID=189382 RepID=UPI0005CA2302|nr:helix-turn-helix domain-containing protein [Rossellomorea aquimaris]
MFTPLRKKYPAAIIQDHYPINLEATKIWFTNDAADEYIGIDKSEITQGEMELLHCLFKEIKNPSGPGNDSPQSMEWFSFLFKNGPFPSNIAGEFRIIQFSMKESLDQLLLKEAFQHLLPLNTTLVLLDDNMGLLIEEKNEWNMDEEQLLSISHVIESDFFVSLSFFIGQFQVIDSYFPLTFKYEQELFSFSRTVQKQSFIQTVVTVLPAFTLHHLPQEWRTQLFSKVAEIFREDAELIYTVKAFLENQSNISQTAKKLFMHRNSVQYRIDKFIEKTNIDIKTFQGGILAYFACLNFQSDNLPKKD